MDRKKKRPPVGVPFRIEDEELLRRLMRVVRLRVGDTAIFFDTHYAWRCRIDHLTLHEALCTIVSQEPHQAIKPIISWVLPLLTAADFEASIYTLTVMGAATIHPLITAKSRQDGLHGKELHRLERIMIAAAEQSKQFVLPQLEAVRSFEEWVSQQRTAEEKIVFFDAMGTPSFSLVTNLRARLPSHIHCLIGPEGDLTGEEKEQLRPYASFVSLVPSILRACDAVTVGMGLLRSCLDNS